MKKQRTSLTFIAAGWMSLFSLHGMADEQTNLEFSLGVAFTHFDNPLRDSPTRNLFLPSVNFTYYGERFFIDEEVGYTLWEHEDGVINLIGSLNLDFINFLDKSKTLRELRGRNPSVMGGVELLLFPLWGELQIQLLNDITGVHNGRDALFSYQTEFRISRWQFVPKAGIRWKSDRLVDYYYGTDERDGTAVPEYHPNAEISHFFALDMEYPVEYNWVVGGYVNYNAFGNEVHNSPLIEKKQTVTAAVGIKYVF